MSLGAAIPDDLVPGRCYAAGCTRTIDRRMLMCGPHWRRVPRRLQNAIYRAWHALDEQYGARVREARDVVARAEGRAAVAT